MVKRSSNGTGHDIPGLPRRVVILGASNVTFGFPTLVATACRLWGRPLDILAAYGLGRSYGLRMSLLWRELPGLVDSGLWQALQRRPPAATAALVTDVGNDLLYGVPVADIAAWVEVCLDRLVEVGARVVMTPLPLCNVIHLSQARFVFFRRLFFPGYRQPYATVMARAFELDRRLRELALQRGVALAQHRPGWYGLDPIHIRRRHIPAAWQDILSAWSEPVPASAPLGYRFGLWGLPAERRWIFGMERHSVQPACRWADGTTLAVY